MPQMADLTIKKLDGITDITYEALSPSSGDKTEAKWRVADASVVPALRSTLAVKAKSSANQVVRIVEGKLVMPLVDSSVTSGPVIGSVFSFTGTVHQNFTDAEAGEFAAQAANLIKASLMQTVLKTGYAPT